MLNWCTLFTFTLRQVPYTGVYSTLPDCHSLLSSNASGWVWRRPPGTSLHR